MLILYGVFERSLFFLFLWVFKFFFFFFGDFIGDTKVLAAVYGPKAGTKKNENPEKACIEVIWKPKTGQSGEFILPSFMISYDKTKRNLFDKCMSFEIINALWELNMNLV